MNNEKIMLKGMRGELAFYISSLNEKSRKTLLCLHGGPNGDHRGNKMVFDEIVAYALPMGFNIILFDMYGSGDSSGKQIDFNLSSMREDYKTALSYFEKRFGGDLHIVGESMGATVAAMDWFEKATSNILLWPAFDLIDTDLNPYLKGEWRKILQSKGFIKDGDIEMGESFLNEIETFDFDSCFVIPNIPTLIIHGRKDTAVPYTQSLRATNEAHGEVTLCLHPSGNHGLQEYEERKFTHKVIRKWLEEY